MICMFGHILLKQYDQTIKNGQTNRETQGLGLKPLRKLQLKPRHNKKFAFSIPTKFEAICFPDKHI